MGSCLPAGSVRAEGCVRGWVPVLCRAERLRRGPVGRLGRGVPAPACPPPPSSQGLIHPPPHLLLEQAPCCGASVDAGTPVPVCMYPQPAVPDSPCKSSPGAGLLLPSRARSFAFASPGENLPGGKGPGQSQSPLHRGAGLFSSLVCLGPLLCRGAGRLWVAVAGGAGGPLETSLGSRCGLWHQGNVGARPPGRGGPGASNG